MKKIINIIYASIYQFVLVPILGFLTYLMYDKLAYLDIVQDSRIMFILLIGILVFLNVGAVYFISYVYNRFYKCEIVYYRIIGIIAIFIAIWYKVYYVALVKNVCVANDSVKCISTIKNNNLLTIALIALVTYYLVFLVTFKIANSKRKKSIK